MINKQRMVEEGKHSRRETGEKKVKNAASNRPKVWNKVPGKRAGVFFSVRKARRLTVSNRKLESERLRIIKWFGRTQKNLFWCNCIFRNILVF